MAPPRKRRRLLDSLQPRSEMSLFEPIPTLTHEVSDIEYDLELDGIRSVPKHVEEVHLHIQKRSAAFKADDNAELQRRQTAYAITTIDANGNTIISTLTAGLNAGAATSTGPTAITTTTSSTQSSDRTTASAASISPAAASTNSTGTNSNVYVATLTNGNTKTITRSPSPYVTTFGDGETSTICGRNGQCRLASDQSSAAVAGSAVTGSTPAAASGGSSTADDGGGGPSVSTIAGGVVGGLVGLAVILALILVFLRWYKRRLRNGHQALARDSSPTPISEPPFTDQPGMSERASLAPLAGAAPGFFQHQNKSLDESASSERGFLKVSGRKIPSAFPGQGVAGRDMNSPPPEMPLTGAEKDLQGTSFYRDSTGFYGGDGAVSPDSSQHSDQAPAAMTLSPGPQRRPTIHEPAQYVTLPSTSTPSTPAQHVRSPSGPGLGLSPFGDRSETPTAMTRSDTPSTIADNRSSRFTEDF